MRARWILIALAFCAIVAFAAALAGISGGATEFWGGYADALARVQEEPWYALWVVPGLLLGLIAALGLGIRTSP